MSTHGIIWLTALLFASGLLVMITKRNVLVLLIGVELMFNAANINFVYFNQFWLGKGLDGQLMSLFVLAIVAAELALALAIVLKAIKAFGTSNIDEFNSLKD
jgi:NADH-quinone oxidoreductase subunit K